MLEESERTMMHAAKAASIEKRRLNGASSPIFLSEPLPESAGTQASRRGLVRMVQALFREKLLPASRLVTEGNISWLPLWSHRAVLRFEDLQVGRIGNCRLSGSITYCKTGQEAMPVATAAVLLACIAEDLPGEVRQEDLARLTQELENSLENDTLCLTYRHEWAARLLQQFNCREKGLIAALREATKEAKSEAKAGGSKEINPVLLLEQWGTLGHPWHPNYKTKIGLTKDEVVALSPEFEASIRVPIAAVKSSYVHVETSKAGTDYRSWFAESFPDVMRQWSTVMEQEGLSIENWLPLPLHPYQVRHYLPREFARELDEEVLRMLPDVSLAAAPTMSFRTIVPDGSVDAPNIKLPVSLRLTSVTRTVSPKSAVMGPRIAALLEKILAHEEEFGKQEFGNQEDGNRGFGGRLDFVREEIGIHYLDRLGDEARAGHLGALFRANPAGKRTQTLFPVPVGSLFADSPCDGRALVTELVAHAYGDNADGAVRFFAEYADTVLSATLGVYLLYGIAFEAHQQNSFIMVDEQYRPGQLLVRDFGDVRIHRPTLERAGFSLQAHRKGHVMFDRHEPVRDKLLHAVFLCHISEVALLLSYEYAIGEAVMWNVFRARLIHVFDMLKPRTQPDRWQAERLALLEEDWPAKSFLRMRLLNTSEDMLDCMPNPLAEK